MKSDGCVDCWTWIHAGCGGLFFCVLSSLRQSKHASFAALVWPSIAGVLLLAVVWEVLECLVCCHDVWRRLHGAWEFMREKCSCIEGETGEQKHRKQQDGTEYKGDVPQNSVLDVLVLCATYTVSCVLWTISSGVGRSIGIAAVPTICFIVAIVHWCNHARCMDKFRDDDDDDDNINTGGTAVAQDNVGLLPIFL